ncbi:MAG: T9SS type A sorting domain-containing protein [Calditrichaeota bacterium]|nr:T9SS type A sorting domain-containing protein [Calditrichota bacterium]
MGFKRQLQQWGLILFGLFFCEGIFAASITIEWDANQEKDLAGYRIYWGTMSRNYQHQADVGMRTQFQINDLQEGMRYYMAVTAVDLWGNESSFSQEIRFVLGEELPLPDKVELSLNFPNPFNESTMFNYALPERDRVTISIYNQIGQVVKTIECRNADAGTYQIFWDGTDEAGNSVSAGIYFCKMKTSLELQTREITLLR